jgi:hypothetical protein
MLSITSPNAQTIDPSSTRSLWTTVAVATLLAVGTFNELGSSADRRANEDALKCMAKTRAQITQIRTPEAPPSIDFLNLNKPRYACLSGKCYVLPSRVQCILTMPLSPRL